jgi:hypothetical protein
MGGAPHPLKRKRGGNFTADNQLLYALFLRTQSGTLAVAYPTTKPGPSALQKGNSGSIRNLQYDSENKATYPLFLRKEDASGALIDTKVAVTQKHVLVRLTAAGTALATTLGADEGFSAKFHAADWHAWLHS